MKKNAKLFGQQVEKVLHDENFQKALMKEITEFIEKEEALSKVEGEMFEVANSEEAKEIVRKAILNFASMSDRTTAVEPVCLPR